eukprot:TRINITY_DN4046_c0_g1_i3.p2 TRINITY_DN4046_c0_g1~~TRINITY_DN4046_c0_g1_i3.p2  ORF type:complete len:271 (+),score=24.33 TRINITY_DN4046_c0_g1_i3:1845-2657(+)
MRVKPPAANRIEVLTLGSITKAVSLVAMRAAMSAAAMLVPPTATEAASATAVEKAAAARRTAADVKKAGAALAQLLMDGLQPLCVDIIKTIQQKERLLADLSRLAQKIDTQGVGHEQTAKAVIVLRNAKKPETIDDRGFKGAPSRQGPCSGHHSDGTHCARGQEQLGRGGRAQRSAACAPNARYLNDQEQNCHGGGGPLQGHPPLHNHPAAKDQPQGCGRVGGGRAAAADPHFQSEERDKHKAQKLVRTAWRHGRLPRGGPQEVVARGVL